MDASIKYLIYVKEVYPSRSTSQFSLLSNKVHFDEGCIKDIFHFGLNEPIKSWLPEGQFNVSLRDFMDYALLCAGSSFTVGVAEEESGTAYASEMVDAPKCAHVMAVTTTPRHVSAASHESIKSLLMSKSQVKSQLMSKSQVKSQLMSKSQVKSQLMSKSQVKSQLMSKSQVKFQLMSKSQVKSQLMSKSQVKSQLMSKSQVKSQLMSKSQVKVPADVKEPSQVPADVKEPSPNPSGC